MPRDDYAHGARQILRRAPMSPELEAGGLGSQVHGFFVEAEAFDLEVPARSLPRDASGNCSQPLRLEDEVSSLKADPPGFLTPRSQSETRFFDTFR